MLFHKNKPSMLLTPMFIYLIIWTWFIWNQHQDFNIYCVDRMTSLWLEEPQFWWIRLQWLRNWRQRGSNDFMTFFILITYWWIFTIKIIVIPSETKHPEHFKTLRNVVISFSAYFSLFNLVEILFLWIKIISTVKVKPVLDLRKFITNEITRLTLNGNSRI